MGSESLHFQTLMQTSDQIRRREISPVEVTTVLLERIEQLDGKYHSYALVLRERALYQAKAAEQEIGKGIWRGPLHGVPIAVKDLCNTTFAPTAAGTTLFRNWTPERNATVVDRLEQAGAVMLGKLKMTEGAYTTHHPSDQAPLNSWNAAHWVGSSSSGSGVATSAGLCYGSLGSDTGGPIRFPPAPLKPTRIKPARGPVSPSGRFAPAPSHGP